jgi:predicted nucleic acid-binding protein
MSAAIIDACALINLIRSGGAERILSSIPLEVWFEGLVDDEIVTDRAVLESLLSAGLIHRFDGSSLSASAVGEVAASHEIGVGEAECLTICIDSGELLISDDRRARNVGQSLLGSENVTGFIGLLCQCIDGGAISSVQAATWLANAQNAGGFLPDFDFEKRQLVA